jgi:hypothetical protein
VCPDSFSRRSAAALDMVSWLRMTCGPGCMMSQATKA